MRDPNRLCPGCMSEWGHPDQPCPVCGFAQKKYEKPPRWLPLKHILNGKYMIGKVIGEGGFGITYIGWDLNLQVRVAVKEYFPVGLAARETGNGNDYTIAALPGIRQENYRQGLEKFMTEAKNLSKFYNLKGIVAVKDFFFENDTAYMVMEFVDGITLGKYLKDHGGQIGETEVLQLFRPVMESLKVVHQSGIIHRDISPDNIMMTKDGKMKLIDFGAARFAGGDTERSLTIILKHGYAPAEQYQSHGNQGPWTDVYAISATMYRMITGKVPPSAMDRLHQDTLEEFETLGCQVSTKTAYAILDKGLAIRVEDRYKNMDELIQGLYGMDQKKVQRKKKQKKPNRGIAVAAVSVAAVLGIGGIFLGISGKEEPISAETLTQSQITDAKTPDTENLKNTAGEQNAAKISKTEFSKVSLEELKTMQQEAIEAKKKISAADAHLVLVREDGSVVGSGTNHYKDLDVSRWKDIQMIATGIYHTVGVKEDGTVTAVGETSNGKCAVDAWKTIQKAAVGNSHTLGLREDGTVLAAGSNSNQQCMVSEWSDIVDISAGAYGSYGLKADGTVVMAGADESVQEEVKNWTDLVQIEGKGNTIAGLRSDGSVLIAGEWADELKAAADWEQVISIQLGDDYIAGLLTNKTVVVAGDGVVTQEMADSWTDIEAIAAADDTLFGRKSDGSIVKTIYSYGTTDREGMTDLKKAVSGGGYLAGLKADGTAVVWGVSGKDFGVEAISEWNDLVDLAACEDGIFGLQSDGTVEVIGEAYQGVKEWSEVEALLPKRSHEAVVNPDGTVSVAGSGGYANVYSWNQVTDAVVGAEHTIGLRSDGTLLAAGSNANGQCEISTWTDVVSIAAGDYYTLGVKSDGTLLIAGKIPGEY